MSPRPARMILIVQYVNDHPGCSKVEAARCGPVGNSIYADSMYRAIRQGFLSEQEVSSSRYALQVTDKGRSLLAYDIEEREEHSNAS